MWLAVFQVACLTLYLGWWRALVARSMSDIVDNSDWLLAFIFLKLPAIFAAGDVSLCAFSHFWLHAQMTETLALLQQTQLLILRHLLRTCSESVCRSHPPNLPLQTFSRCALAGMGFWCLGPYDEPWVDPNACSAEDWIVHGVSMIADLLVLGFLVLLMFHLTPLGTALVQFDRPTSASGSKALSATSALSFAIRNRPGSVLVRLRVTAALGVSWTNGPDSKLTTDLVRQAERERGSIHAHQSFRCHVFASLQRCVSDNDAKAVDSLGAWASLAMHSLSDATITCSC